MRPIEATYLIPPGSPIKAIADVDRKGVRIAISDRSAYDLYLTRELKHAELIRERRNLITECPIRSNMRRICWLRPWCNSTSNHALVSVS